MVLGIIFVLVNIGTLITLLYRRYWKLYPWFCVALAATCWQAGTVLWMGSRINDRAFCWQYWPRGELWLLIATSIAIIEAVSHSVNHLKSKWLTIAGWIACSCGITSIVWSSIPSVPGDALARFISARMWFLLACGIFSAIGCLYGLIIARREWGRPDRMHLTLYAVLLFFMCVFSGMSSWFHHHLSYRVAEMGCCVGWLLNASFVAGERVEVQGFRNLEFPLSRVCARLLGGYHPSASRPKETAHRTEPQAA